MHDQGCRCCETCKRSISRLLVGASEDGGTTFERFAAVATSQPGGHELQSAEEVECGDEGRLASVSPLLITRGGSCSRGRPAVRHWFAAR